MTLVSSAQQRTLNRMREREGRGAPASSAYKLGATMMTIGALLEKGLIVSAPSPTLGTAFSPRTTLQYRLAEEAKENQRDNRLSICEALREEAKS